VALAAAGCSGKHATAQEQQLERADLVAAAHTLRGAEASVGSEVEAAKAAWPLVSDGVPAHPSASWRAAVALADRRAGAMRLPALFAERGAASLTGPASGLAGTFRSFGVLSARGWRLIDAAGGEVQHGDALVARFARENVALYVECVYDAHFGLAQLGKRVLKAYKTLGGSKAFGSSLTQAEVDGLAAFYSEASDRLHPRARVRLGS